MIVSRMIILTPAVQNKLDSRTRYEWHVPIPAKLCSLVGHKTYKNPRGARKAARLALYRLFGGYGDMI